LTLSVELFSAFSWWYMQLNYFHLGYVERLCHE